MHRMNARISLKNVIPSIIRRWDIFSASIRFKVTARASNDQNQTEQNVQKKLIVRKYFVCDIIKRHEIQNVSSKDELYEPCDTLHIAFSKTNTHFCAVTQKKTSTQCVERWMLSVCLLQIYYSTFFYSCCCLHCVTGYVSLDFHRSILIYLIDSPDQSSSNLAHLEAYESRISVHLLDTFGGFVLPILSDVEAEKPTFAVYFGGWPFLTQIDEVLFCNFYGARVYWSQEETLHQFVIFLPGLI